jgi:predicted RNase H-like HicB family nuclease
MRRIKLTRVIQKEDDGFVSFCPELDIASQGDTKDEARTNLEEAIDGFLETAGPQEINDRLSSERYVETFEVNVG